MKLTLADLQVFQSLFEKITSFTGDEWPRINVESDTIYVNTTDRWGNDETEEYPFEMFVGLDPLVLDDRHTWGDRWRALQAEREAEVARWQVEIDARNAAKNAERASRAGSPQGQVPRRLNWPLTGYSCSIRMTS